MSLREKIAKIKEKASKEDLKAAPNEAELAERSRMIAGCLKAGDRAPSFSLPNHKGTMIFSEDLLAKGPLVVAFYLGGW
jgi:hypothetical protein